MNFQSIEDLDVEHRNVSLELKETVLSLNENSAEKSRNGEEKVQEVEKSSKGFVMKELPKHIKYVFLGAKRAQLVIIVVGLIVEKEHKLIKILRKYKKTIAWPVEDLKGIIPSICIHKILLEENAKTSIEHQRRLNLVIKEIIRKEVLK